MPTEIAKQENGYLFCNKCGKPFSRYVSEHYIKENDLKYICTDCLGFTEEQKKEYNEFLKELAEELKDKL